MRAVSRILILCFASVAPLMAQGGDPAKIAAYLKTLPTTAPPTYDEVQRLVLAANPIGCEDHPHASTRNAPGYLWQREGKPAILENYDEHRAFYGCFDWHSAVNSMWMMVSLIKADPTIAAGAEIRNELRTHIQKENIDGELKFFTGLHGVGADFEKPYGYAWLIKLYGELKSWDDPDGKRAAEVLEPLATWMSKQLVTYLNSLNYPIRIGVHPNTAFDMSFVLDSTALTHDTALENAIKESAMRLFGKDKRCATGLEPVFGDFASPCLSEAALMSRVFPSPEAYSKWLDEFLPPVYDERFQGYSKEIDAEHGDNRDTTGTDEEGLQNSHLIGLNLQRAADLLWIAKGLPQNDPRVPVFRRFAAIDGRHGYDKIGLGGYLGTHWLATYALMYENLQEQGTQASATKK